VHDTGAFAKNINRTRTSAAGSENVRIENGTSRSREIASCNLLNETGHVNMSRASPGTWRIKTVQASIRFNGGSLAIKRRMDVRKARSYLWGRRSLKTE